MFSLRSAVAPERNSVPLEGLNAKHYRSPKKAKSLKELNVSIPARSLAMATSGIEHETSTVFMTSGASERVSALFSLETLRRLAFSIHSLFVWAPLLSRHRSTWFLSSEEPAQQERAAPSLKSAIKDPSPKRRKNFSEDEDVSTRRTLAARRRDMDGSVGRDTSVWQYFLFVNARGETLFTQSWTPVSHNIRGIVVLLHGLNEHSGRYAHFARQLNMQGYKVYGMDWVGHGGSDGLHGYVPSLDQVVSDTKAFLEKVKLENPSLPCFLFGHSTGGAIILKAALDPNVGGMLGGVILTSPALRVRPAHPIFGAVAPVFSLLLPKLQFSPANRRGEPVSRDPEALIAKYTDPLVYTGPIRVRTGSEILRISSYLQRNMKRISVPFLVLHGTADTITDPDASQDLYNQAASEHKTIHLYEGFLHDLLFEIERDDIVRDIIDWMNNKLEQ